MPTHSAVPSRIDLERCYDAPPEMVFAAWSSSEALLRWGSPADGWDVEIEAFAFEIGGEQVTRFSPGNGEIYVNRSRYHDIVPALRIVSSGSMARGADTLFAGVLTVELQPAGSGCLLRLIEQGVFLDGHDQPENHENGWHAMLEKLARHLEPRAAAPRRDEVRP
jgi:uncharacterized protein YndB with AHSA1/START domain